jgi:hypothetical protein
MSLKSHIRWEVEMCHWVTGTYVQDLTDADLMLRPVPGMNHIAWQLGHLIVSTHHMLSGIGQPAPELPAGFAEAHGKETATCDDPAKFATKEVYLGLAAKFKDAALAAIETIPESKFDDPSPEPMREYCPTISSVLSLLGTHWMMHSGQFVAVRRKLGKPAVF